MNWNAKILNLVWLHRAEINSSPENIPACDTYLPLPSPTETLKRTPSQKARLSAAARSSYRGATAALRVFAQVAVGISPLRPQSQDRRSPPAASTQDPTASDRFAAPSGGQSFSSRAQGFSSPLRLFKLSSVTFKWLPTKKNFSETHCILNTWYPPCSVYCWESLRKPLLGPP